MMTIPAGEFLMGSDDHERSKPVHKVKVKTFNLGKYEVTNKEFRQFIDDTHYPVTETCIQMKDKNWFSELPRNWENHTLRGSEFEPVVCIGWKAMQAYTDWLAQKTGKKYRLPSEAEWEYAARAGSSTKYAFGDDETQACRYANIGDRAQEAAFKRDYDGLDSKSHTGVADCDDSAGYASIVGMYKPNAFGIYDTLGNVVELLQDCAHDNYLGAPNDGSAWIDGECKAHSMRPTSWHWQGMGIASRGKLPDDFYGALEGFRVAEDISEGTVIVKKRRPTVFEKELAKEQKLERKRRAITRKID
ncbi:MAG: formylglycine-generating enzyme family protein [Pseudomonadota bacterium]